MAGSFPTKANFATGDVLTASNMNNLADTVNLLESAQYAAGKNKIINGDFGVWQRGTSFNFSSTTGYTADRWQLTWNGSGATRTISQQTFTPGTAPVAGYEGQFYFRYAQTVAGTGGSGNFLFQPIEDVRQLAGQTTTISFWAKADAARSVTVALEQNFGSGGSATVSTSFGTATLTTSWARYTYTVALPSISGKTIGTSSYLSLLLTLPANAVQTIEFWGVQVEASSTASPFQTATGTKQGELAACQRYYYASDKEILYWANVTNANNYYLTAYFPVPMRIAPNMTTTDVANTNFTAGAPSTTVIGKFSFWAFKGASGTGVGNFQFNYTASAEL